MTDEHSNDEDTAMLTVTEACTRLRISKWTLYRLLQEGKLESVKIRRRRLVPMSAIAKLVKQLREAEGGSIYGR